MVEGFRFCNCDEPIISHAAFAEESDPNDCWTRKTVTTRTVLMRAARHMDGETRLSPFVSLATDVAALVQYGISGGLLDIIYGYQDRTKRAPHIGRFRVPDNSVISPDLICNHIDGARALMGILRARTETEILYFGNDIKRYLVDRVDNPYTAEQYEARLEREELAARASQAEAERLAAIQIERAARLPPSIAAGKVLASKDEFAARVRGFLKDNEAVLAADSPTRAALLATLSATNQLALGQTLRKAETAIHDDPAGLYDAWLATTAPYRR